MKTLLRTIIVRIFERQAKRLIETQDLKIIAVGGSVGKTSTKTAIARVLEQQYPGEVLLHAGNYNTEVSVPVSLFDLDLPPTLLNPFAWLRLYRETNRIIKHGYPYRIAILELGTDRPGDIARFMRYLKPDYGVVTTIVPEHMEAFRTIEAVTEEEFTLARHATKPVLNFDDERIRAEAKGLKNATLLSYGKSGQYRLVSSVNTGTNLDITIALAGKNVMAAHAKVVGEHSLYAVLAAVTIGDDMGLSQNQLQKGIESFRSVPGRMSVLEGKNGSTIIDDSYNASPEAVVAAVQTLKEYQGTRKIGVLGSMNELGDTSEEAHKQVGALCGFMDMLITVGDQANAWLAPAAENAGLDTAKIRRFKTSPEAGEFLIGLVEQGDVVLVKGSEGGIYTEEAVKCILRNSDDQQHLVRQSPKWMARKKAFFKDNG